MQYWTDHSLPVVVVLYDEQTKAAHWKLINRKTLERSSRGGWKVLVDHAEHHGSTRRSNHASALRLRP